MNSPTSALCNKTLTFQAKNIFTWFNLNMDFSKVRTNGYLITSLPKTVIETPQKKTLKDKHHEFMSKDKNRYLVGYGSLAVLAGGLVTDILVKKNQINKNKIKIFKIFGEKNKETMTTLYTSLTKDFDIKKERDASRIILETMTEIKNSPKKKKEFFGNLIKKINEIKSKPDTDYQDYTDTANEIIYMI